MFAKHTTDIKYDPMEFTITRGTSVRIMNTVMINEREAQNDCKIYNLNQ